MLLLTDPLQASAGGNMKLAQCQATSPLLHIFCFLIAAIGLVGREFGRRGANGIGKKGVEESQRVG